MGVYIALIAEQVNDTHNFCEFFLDTFAQLFYYLSFFLSSPSSAQCSNILSLLDRLHYNQEHPLHALEHLKPPF
jgi:hypothetical protein